MSLLLYAVTTSGEQVAATGLGGNRLDAIEEHGLTAIVSPVAGNAVSADHDTMWEYEQVLERLMARHAILPARFGSVLADRATVRAMLGDRRQELERALARVSGSVEFGITTAWRDQDESPEPSSGTAYMRSRLDLNRRASEVARRLDPLNVLSRSRRQRLLPRPSLPVTASYLVERSRSDEFIEMVAHVDSLCPEVDLVCTGPWPPYSFVEGVPQ
jgi:Gas vesicle synthesis protein GvpL/GvpF